MDVEVEASTTGEMLHRLVTARWAAAVAAGHGELARRMLRIESALYFALESRGHLVRPGATTVHGEDFAFSLYEANRAEKVALTKKDRGYGPNPPQWRQVLVPSGRPTLLVKPLPHGSERRWSDRGKTVEAQIPTIVRRFEIIADEAIAGRLRSAEYDREFEITRRKAARRYQKELARDEQPETFHAFARDWQEVARLRAFLDALEQRFETRSPDPAIAEWLRWARGYCASFDPLSEGRLSELRRHAEAVAYEPIDDEAPDPDEGEWRRLGMLEDYMEG